MITPPTTTITILGTGEPTYDDYGDPVEHTGEGQSGIPAAIATGREVVATEGDSQARVIRYFTGRVPNGTTITDSQRIRDDRTGDVYVVDNVTRPQHPAVPQDVRLDLRRVT